MGIRTATTGVFLGCLHQLPPKERCKTTMNLTDGNEVIDILSEDAENEMLRSGGVAFVIQLWTVI